MDDLIQWLHTSNDSIIKIAADIHLKLAYIHPFIWKWSNRSIVNEFNFIARQLSFSFYQNYLN